MENNDSSLTDYAASKLRFLTLGEGEEVRVKFLSAEIVPSRFDDGKNKSVQYHLEYEDTEKILTSASGDFARKMAEIPKGSLIFIKRTGQGNQTKYTVTKVALE